MSERKVCSKNFIDPIDLIDFTLRVISLLKSVRVYAVDKDNGEVAEKIFCFTFFCRLIFFSSNVCKTI